MEGDLSHSGFSSLYYVFKSTPSAWRVTGNAGLYSEPILQISIHTLRMEGDPAERRAGGNTPISIHTLRMEGDA